MKNKLYTLLWLSLFGVAGTQAQQWNGYTLYSTMQGTTTYLIDTNNTNYKTWTHASADKTCYSSYLAPGGTLVRSVAKTGNSFTGGPICGRIQKVDWNGTVTWSYDYSTTNEVSHHDHHVMPNGNVLLICYDRRSASEATQAGSTQAIEIWSEKIVEIQPTGATTGTVVWEWKLWDHLVQNVDPNKSNYQSSIVNNPQLMNINYSTKKDWVHMNGIDYNPMLDQITVSSHNLNEWWVIDHSTTTAEAAGHTGGNAGKGGDFLYRWGNPAAYSAAGTAVLKVTHDAHWIPEGSPNAGRLVGFNNQGISTNQSSVDQIQQTVSNYTYTLGSPSSYTQRHACNGYSSNMGNSNQFPNGNMMICVATQGYIYEIDPNGNNIWSKQVTGSVPQAHRYTPCYVANAAPATPTITANSGTLTCTPATTYQWYLNGTLISGATSQTYVPTQDGIYVVRITDSNGCVYMYSAGYAYTNTTSVAELSAADLIHVYPNPTSGEINFEIRYEGEFATALYDPSGRQIATGNNQKKLDLSNYPNGLYLLKIQTADGQNAQQKILLTR